MLGLRPKKVVIHGWNAFTASLADGLKNKYPDCTIICPEISNDEKHLLLDKSPNTNPLIYEDADFVIINQSTEETLELIRKIKIFLGSETYVLDFQPIKSKTYNYIAGLLDQTCFYISFYVFLDQYPCEITIRQSIFRDKIVAVVCDGSTKILKTAQQFWLCFGSKIVPTSSDFFDEIIAETNQAVMLISAIYAHILQKDSWASTLFFGFYNKNLRSFLKPLESVSSNDAKYMMDNRENIRRVFGFIKRELELFDKIIEEEDSKALESYLKISQKFQDRI